MSTKITALTTEILRLLDVIGTTLETEVEFTITTCDAPNWSEVTRLAMEDFYKAGISGMTIQVRTKHECQDWTIRRESIHKEYQIP